jgi:hypothetical protein
VFAGGAVVAGLPYGCAASAKEAYAAMFTERMLSACALGDRVRAASKHRGPWPKISVWHGTADPIVRPCNGEDVIRQWTDLHGLPTHPSREERIAGHIRRLWLGADGNPRIEALSLTGMAHAVPLGLSTEADAYGAVGPFFVDVGICSTQRIAHFWGLGRERASARPTAADATGTSVQIAATADDADRGDRRGVQGRRSAPSPGNRVRHRIDHRRGPGGGGAAQMTAPKGASKIGPPALRQSQHLPLRLCWRTGPSMA